MKIYVASSWRNDRQPEVVSQLRAAGHDVFDFREGHGGFEWETPPFGWTPWDQLAALRTDDARATYTRDMRALVECDVLVLVQPCGISAHLELGHAIGSGKPAIVLMADGVPPEIMTGMATSWCTDIVDVLELVETLPVLVHASRRLFDA